MTEDTEFDLCLLALMEGHPDAIDRARDMRQRIEGELKAAVHLGKFNETFQDRALELYQRRRAIQIALLDLGNRSAPIEQGPTAELLLQIRKGRKGDPLVRLWTQEKIDDDQLKRAREIGNIVYSVVRNQHAKTMKLPVKIDDPGELPASGYRDMIEATEWTAMLHMWVYLPWADRVRADIDMILGLIVEGESVNTLARRYRMRKAKVVNKFRWAIDEYEKIRRGYLKNNEEGATKRQPRVDYYKPPEGVVYGG